MLEEFAALLSGHFDNIDQKHHKEQEGDCKFPYCRHINTICNDKIQGLPEDFHGIFMVEESYYTVGDNTHSSSHLFLFTKQDDNVVLTSYETPKQQDQNTFTYDNMEVVDYKCLKPSEKFTPAIYSVKDGVWEGGSVSMFSPVMKFILFERFSSECLEVSETIEVNGKRTFGYDDAIIYKRS